MPKFKDILCSLAKKATWCLQIFIQIVKKEEEKQISAFLTGNSHCKTLMTIVTVIHNLVNGKQNEVKEKVAFQPRSGTHQA